MIRRSWVRALGTTIDPRDDVAVGSAIYPFAPSGDVVDKLTFVHRQVTRLGHRERAHASR